MSSLNNLSHLRKHPEIDVHGLFPSAKSALTHRQCGFRIAFFCAYRVDMQRSALTRSTSLVWGMIFIESPVFTEELVRLLADDEYAALQEYLAHRPDAGDLIRHSGGLREVRWKTQGRGKRGGVRVIYYYVVARTQIRMLLIYRKGLKDDLSQKEKTILRNINEHWQR